MINSSSNRVQLKVLLFTLTLFLAGFMMMLIPNRTDANATVFSKGSFLQPNIALKWTVADWEQEMLTLKEVGNELLIIQWTADSTPTNMYTYYPTSIPNLSIDPMVVGDLVENVLTAADNVGMNIWLGLNRNNEFSQKHANDQTWLYDHFALSETVLKELWDNYGHHSSLTGFYHPSEMDNFNFIGGGGVPQNRMKTVYGSLADTVHSYTGKTISISPAIWRVSTTGFPGYSTAWKEMWINILSGADLDYIMVQDCIGRSNPHTFQELDAWYQVTKQATDTKPTTKLWANAETFVEHSTTTTPWWAESAPISRVVQQMNTAAPYVTGMVTFSYDHYQSPKFGKPMFHESYKHYYLTGNVDAQAPSTPTSLSVVKVGTDIVSLKWQASTDNIGAMYYVYRDGVKVGRTDSTTFVDFDSGLTANTTYTYTVQAYDGAGNFSAISSGLPVTSAGSQTNIALGKSYTNSLIAAAAYPDTNDTELTDGVYGLPAYYYSAWQGRFDYSPLEYSFVVDLGTVTNIQGLTASFFSDNNSNIALPQSVEFQLSNDNVSFTSTGTVGRKGLFPTAYLTTSKYSLLTSDPASARYVKVIVKGERKKWSFIGEIAVLQYPEVNHALHKSYTTFVAADPQYPDTNNTEVTDGVYATTTYTDSAWQGHRLTNSYSFTINLGSAQSIRQFESTFLRKDGAGIVLPPKVKYYTSMTGTQFTQVAEVATPASTDLTIVPYAASLNDSVVAQYVKVFVENGPTWSFVDEVKLLQ
jgi:chitodextrinase